MSSELGKNLEDLRAQIDLAWELLDLNTIHTKIKQGELEMTQPDFWSDQEYAQKLSQEISSYKQEFDIWSSMKQKINDLISMLSMQGVGEDLLADIQSEYEKLHSEYIRQEFKLMMAGQYDSQDALITVHAGSGGTDAQDWADILLRMILRYCEQKGFKYEILTQSSGSEAGIKSCTFQVHGKFAFGYLKSESGVHRLVRISPFDAEKMRHTSFAMIEVLPLLDEINTSDIQINTNDIRIDTYRASGAGGQHVNKTDSAVRITHEPTGIVVACQSERSQLQNKETALKILKSKLVQFEQAKKDEEKKQLRGEYNEAAWGNQIRSYVLHPYKMVKDMRTSYETSQVQDVLDGNLEGFVESYLRWLHSENKNSE